MGRVDPVVETGAVLPDGSLCGRPHRHRIAKLAANGHLADPLHDRVPKICPQRKVKDCLDQVPNQRARRLAPKCAFSATSSGDGGWNVPVRVGPDRKSMSTLPTRPSPNSM
jgi:hypothetical protein